jgi:hypothetical protein
VVKIEAKIIFMTRDWRQESRDKNNSSGRFEALAISVGRQN